MAVTDVSAADQDAIGSFLEWLEYVVGRYGCRTHYPYQAYIWWILHTADTCQIGSTICTPVTDKRDYFWLKNLTGQNFLLWSLWITSTMPFLFQHKAVHCWIPWALVLPMGRPQHKRHNPYKEPHLLRLHLTQNYRLSLHKGRHLYIHGNHSKVQGWYGRQLRQP